MKFLLSIILLSISTSAMASAVSLAKKTENGETITVYPISSTTLTAWGIQIYVQEKPACLISSVFLKETNTSGLDLLHELNSSQSELIVDCEQDPTSSKALFQATKIRISSTR